MRRGEKINMVSIKHATKEASQLHSFTKRWFPLIFFGNVIPTQSLRSVSYCIVNLRMGIVHLRGDQR